MRQKSIFQNVEVRVEGATLTLFGTLPLDHCAICKRSSYTKNEYNFFNQKLDAEYFSIQQFFQKKQHFPRKLKNSFVAHFTMF